MVSFPETYIDRIIFVHFQLTYLPILRDFATLLFSNSEKKMSNLISISGKYKIPFRIKLRNAAFIPRAASWDKAASWPNRIFQTVDSTSNQGP